MEAAVDRAAAGGKPIVEIMIPLTVTREEMHEARGWVEEAIADAEAAAGADGKAKRRIKVMIGTMIETPRAAIRADEIAEEADFFSFGTNDLTQMTFGFSRDDVETRMMPAYLEHGLLKRNPFETIDQAGVGELVRLGVAAGPQDPAGHQARRVRRARRRPRVDRPVLGRRPRLRVLLAVPGADRPAGRRPGDPRISVGGHPLSPYPRDQIAMPSSLLLAASEAVRQVRRPRHPRLGVGGPRRASSPLLLVVDLLVVHREAHVITFKEAAIESAVWITIGARLHRRHLPDRWRRRWPAAGEYISGFLIEKSLSVDNVFVWAVIFSYFAVPPKYQFRTLFWGIFGALVLRAVFIFAGVGADLERSTVTLAVFGVVLLYTAWKLAFHDEARGRPGQEHRAAGRPQGHPVDHRVRRPEAVHQAATASGWPRRCSRC